MKNKGILSPVIIKENLKRNAYLAVLAVVVYFMSGILIFTMMDNSGKEELIKFSLQHMNPGYQMIATLLPLIASVVSMTFMHKKVQAMNLAAMPFSRKKIFLSNILSGWIICIVPAVINGLLVAVISAGTGSFFGASMIWMLQTICHMTFYYGMFTFAGALVGTTVKQVLLSGVFYWIVPVVTLCTIGYVDNFIPGYAETPDFVEKLIRLTNPAVDAAIGLFGVGAEETQAITPVYYLAAGLLMLLISVVLYNKVKLEKIGKSVVFKTFEDVLTWMVTFVGMSIFGLLVFVIISTKASAIVGMIIGGLLSFAIIKIIIEKSINIFTKRNMISLVGFLIFAMIFSAVVIFDAVGFGKKIPATGKVESVSVETQQLFREYNMYVDNAYLKSEENIENAVKLHEYAIKNYTDEYASWDDDYNLETLTIEYKLKNGTTMKRRYTVKTDDYYQKLVKNIKTSDEYAPAISIENLVDIESLDNVELCVDIYAPEKENCLYNEVIVLTDKEKIKELFDVCDKVKYENSIKDNHSDEDTYFNHTGIYINVYQRNNSSDNVSEFGENSATNQVLSIDVNKNDTELIEYIEKVFEAEGKESFAAHLQ